MIKDGSHGQPDAAPTVCLWYPKAGQLSIHHHQPGDEEETFWYYELTPGIMLAVGRYLGDLDDDIAAMQKLAADAAELARLLQEKKAAAGA